MSNLYPFCIFTFSVIMLYFHEFFDLQISQQQIKGEKKIALFIFLFEFLYLIFSYYYFLVKNKFTIHFTNKSIDFYKNGVLERKISRNNLKYDIVKSFWQNSHKSTLNSLYDILFLPCNIILIVAFGWLAVIFKFLFHIIFGGNPKYFTSFPSISLNSLPQYSGFPYSAWMIAGKNYLVYIIKRQDYLDLKEYFLQTNNIDIDYIEKSYFI